jgi:hypothetical protein
VAFALANTGTDPLRITEVTTSCGCTTTSYPQTLRPGEHGVLQAKLASSPIWKGRVEKEITVMSNDPDQPSMKLQLVAQVRPLLQISPPNPFAVPYQKGAVIRQVFTITAEGRPVRIAGVAAGGAGAEARLLPAQSDDPPGLSRVEVTVHPPENGGDFSTAVSLQTTDPRVPLVPIIVTALCQDAVTVSPSFVYLGLIRDASSGEPPRVISVFKRRGTFHVLGVKTDTPALEAAVGDGAGPNTYEVTLRYVGGWKPGSRTGKLEIMTDDPSSPKVEVPYAATVN